MWRALFRMSILTWNNCTIKYNKIPKAEYYTICKFQRLHCSRECNRHNLYIWFTMKPSVEL